MIPPVHPFPARMAPDVAIGRLKRLSPNALILDPMSGSGTVLRHAIDLGHRALGFDADPLAVLMGRVWTRPFNDCAVQQLMSLVMDGIRNERDSHEIDWIDSDEETSSFIDFWFAEPQKTDLRRISSILAKLDAQGMSRSQKDAIDVLKLGLSRIIITKDQGVSLARDTSHSRPHKVAGTSVVEVVPAFERSVQKIRKLLSSNPPKGHCKVGLGDARSLDSVEAHTVDAVLTSPPYLNAIDYMRGHRMSLVWLGYRLGDLRRIRSDNIGAERGPDIKNNGRFTEDFQANLDFLLEGMLSSIELSSRQLKMVERYCMDIQSMMAEIARVLKPNGRAILVVGNSCLKGQFIKNSEGVTRAAKLVGLRLRARIERELPNNSRYLPIPKASNVPLGKRMRTETVLTFTSV